MIEWGRERIAGAQRALEMHDARQAMRGGAGGPLADMVKALKGQVKGAEEAAKAADAGVDLSKITRLGDTIGGGFGGGGGWGKLLSGAAEANVPYATLIPEGGTTGARASELLDVQRQIAATQRGATAAELLDVQRQISMRQLDPLGDSFRAAGQSAGRGGTARGVNLGMQQRMDRFMDHFGRDHRGPGQRAAETLRRSQPSASSASSRLRMDASQRTYQFLGETTETAADVAKVTKAQEAVVDAAAVARQGSWERFLAGTSDVSLDDIGRGGSAAQEGGAGASAVAKRGSASR
jgi:hypothetical protein